jgi:hypothetical protein
MGRDAIKPTSDCRAFHGQNHEGELLLNKGALQNSTLAKDFL